MSMINKNTKVASKIQLVVNWGIRKWTTLIHITTTTKMQVLSVDLGNYFYKKSFFHTPATGLDLRRTPGSCSGAARETQK